MRTLETQRLILRQPQPRDQDAYATFFLSDRARFVQQASSRSNAWKIFAAEIGHWTMQLDVFATRSALVHIQIRVS